MTESNIENKDFMATIGEQYLSYALSTIMSRSLPDVRDGLKPVHRRLLYAMLQLKLDPKSGFKKCARIVGDVIGKYHPHGDVAVYETLVRLAQNFSVRYPLIEGQGNFGSIDGDNAAAMRYTESKLTDAAMELLIDIDKDTVDFKDTYDGNDIEPILLPARFPNILANGSEGIAVGMATSIPPHNIAELCDGLLALIQNKNISLDELIKYIPGPDFPTGGIIVEPYENILSIYQKGKGSIKVRAKWLIESLPHGMYEIIVTEIPYQVQKSKLIEKIVDLYKNKKLPNLGNIRDESAEEIRIIFEPKNRNCDPNILMESLFKFTDLESNINVNMNMLNSDSIPVVMNLKSILESFLEYRKNIVIRRSRYQLARIDHRINIIEGLIIVYANLDEIIRIIREEDDVKVIFLNRFKLNEIQIESILNIKLRSLRKLEEIELKEEYKQLLIDKEQLNQIISIPSKALKIITNEIKTIQKKFSTSSIIGKRKTDFGKIDHIDDSIILDSLVEKEDLTIICSKFGWMKSFKTHNVDPDDIKYKEDDSEKFIIKASTIDRLILFCSNGKFYTINCNKISKFRNSGESIRILFDIDDNDDIIDIFINQDNRKFLVAAKSGKGFIVEESEIIAQTKSGKQILNLADNDRGFMIKQVTADHIAIIGTNRKLVIYKTCDIPIMKKGQGVFLQKYAHAELSDFKFFNIEQGLSWRVNNKIKTEKDLLAWIGKRGSIGRIPPTGFPADNKFN